MHINMQNLDNLMGIWKKYGANRIRYSDYTNIYVNHTWPHRAWIESSKPDAFQVESVKQMLGNNDNRELIIPVWNGAKYDQRLSPKQGATEFAKILENQGCRVKFRQTAMYLDLLENNQKTPINSLIKLMHIGTDSMLSNWVRIASDAFGYKINQDVIRCLIEDPSINLLLCYIGNEPVATALLFESKNTVGLHQLGVSRAYQEKGIARESMHKLIKMCVDNGNQRMVLQSSDAGLKLYQSLGFKEQFSIINYEKPKVNAR